MPYKKKTYRKKPYKKSYRRKAVIRQPSIVADSQIVTLKYCDHVTFDAGIGTKSYTSWRATSAFDPYVPLGGHQPLGFDNWTQFYNHYTILGAKATAHYSVPSDLASDAVIAVGKLSDEETWAPTDVNTLIEQNKTKYTFLTARGGSNSTGNITVYYSPRKMFGLSKVSDEHDLRGQTGNAGTGSDPTENAYFHFGLAGMNPSDNPVAVNCRVIIEYRIKFTERKDLAGS